MHIKTTKVEIPIAPSEQGIRADNPDYAAAYARALQQMQLAVSQAAAGFRCDLVDMFEFTNNFRQ